MKTQPLRRKKDCLNCGNDVPNRFCGYCGQENVVPHETFGHLVKHFVADIFHYDSQFLLTLKYLFTRPGFLSREYREGRRVRYVNPIKLYVFTSFIFFFIYLAGLSHPDRHAEPHNAEDSKEAVRLGYFDELVIQEKKLDAGVKRNDPAAIRNLHLLEKIAASTSTEEFDDVYRQLPDSLKFSLLTRLVVRAEAGSLKHYRSNEERVRYYEEKYYHNFPKIMLLCLPLFAYFLKLLYFRNKQWLYADHAIFTLHIHVFAFILLSVMLPLMRYFHHPLLFYKIFSCIVAGYLIIALRKNYGQSILISGIKGVTLYAGYLTLLWAVLMIVNLLLATYSAYF
ncbi:DUF3667 domain-containing protein [Chitinophaga qingshengii]|uniref:DUF3667 domain-containing protein n=1 Tax=Chitinophaga qingshengii TaxID=1569794 RepID=A0ABR7TIA9_9BACT|nr:DUF3667 domain-containing protein [Chitinophaga qingshengii]MBC9929246.1 DUF3667 domain-containing protein [Chitinophaga qingshengii]